MSDINSNSNSLTNPLIQKKKKKKRWITNATNAKYILLIGHDLDFGLPWDNSL